MDTRDTEVLLTRIAKLEQTQARQAAEIAVYRGALVWLMGFHQLDHEDKNPRRAVLEPLGLSFDHAQTNPEGLTDPQLTAIALEFVDAAHQVFLSRQSSGS